MNLNWFSFSYSNLEGYPRLSLNLIRALLNRGFVINPRLCSEIRDIPLDILRYSINESDLTILVDAPEKHWRSPFRKWGLSMWESSSLPEFWTERINQNVERLIVPCKHNEELFIREGVKVPIHILPM